MYTTSGLVSISYVHAVFDLPTVPRVSMVSHIYTCYTIHGTNIMILYHEVFMYFLLGKGGGNRGEGGGGEGRRGEKGGGGGGGGEGRGGEMRRGG